MARLTINSSENPSANSTSIQKLIYRDHFTNPQYGGIHAIMFIPLIDKYQIKKNFERYARAIRDAHHWLSERYIRMREHISHIMTDHDVDQFMKVISKIRVKSLQKFLILSYNSRTISAYLPKKYGGWGLEYKKDRSGERLTADSLRELMEKTFGIKYTQRVSQRTLLDYVYALQALHMVPP